MINKFLKKIRNMSTKEWILVSLWLVSFIMLIVFVIVAATVPKGSVKDIPTAETYANATAGVGACFVILLSASLLTTVVFAYLNRKRGIKDDKNK